MQPHAQPAIGLDLIAQTKHRRIEAGQLVVNERQLSRALLSLSRKPSSHSNTGQAAGAGIAASR